jgi:hypothetical protein
MSIERRLEREANIDQQASPAKLWTVLLPSTISPRLGGTTLLREWEVASWESPVIQQRRSPRVASPRVAPSDKFTTQGERAYNTGLHTYAAPGSEEPYLAALTSSIATAFTATTLTATALAATLATAAIE